MNTASGPASKSTPVNCPQCQGLFRLPGGISVKSVVVCPHCQGDLSVNDLLSDLPVAEVSAESASTVNSPVVGSPDDQESVAPQLSFDEQAFTIPKPLKTAERSSRRRSHPSRRSSGSGSSSGSSSSGSKSKAPFAKKKQGSREGLKVLLGGILALPIAQIILWWVFAVDPLNLAPRIWPLAPSIVPPALRPAHELDDSDSGYSSIDMPPGQILNDEGIPYDVTK